MDFKIAENIEGYLHNQENRIDCVTKFIFTSLTWHQNKVLDVKCQNFKGQTSGNLIFWTENDFNFDNVASQVR